MSGGSWDYVYRHIQDAADRLQNEKCPYRRALGKRLSLMAKALHDIEWVDSYDMSHPDEMPAIHAALGESPDEAALAELVSDARKLRDDLAGMLVAIDARKDGVQL